MTKTEKITTSSPSINLGLLCKYGRAVAWRTRDHFGMQGHINQNPCHSLSIVLKKMKKYSPKVANFRRWTRTGSPRHGVAGKATLKAYLNNTKPFRVVDYSFIEKKLYCSC